MKNLYLLLLFTLTVLTANAQNLIVNGDFESNNACPDGNHPYWDIAYSPTYSSFPTVKNWISPINTSPDYLNACSPNYIRASPVNYYGFQLSHSGNGYGGIVTFFSFPYKEYLTTKFVRPMVKDSIYKVSFFVNSADGGYHGSGGMTDNLSGGRLNNVIAVNEIGANISDTLPTSNIAKELKLPYHIKNSPNRTLSDTSLWYEISGEYIAKGGSSG